MRLIVGDGTVLLTPDSACNEAAPPEPIAAASTAVTVNAAANRGDFLKLLYNPDTSFVIVSVVVIETVSLNTSYHHHKKY